MGGMWLDSRMAAAEKIPDRVVVRDAECADAAALVRLAERDSAEVPPGRLLVAETHEGQLVAAIPIAGGPAIADPFRQTAAIVALLELRAAQLRRLEHPHGRLTLRARTWFARLAGRPATG
jgi:hypothetical protein